jgi:hypothetical protein
MGRFMKKLRPKISCDCPFKPHTLSSARLAIGYVTEQLIPTVRVQTEKARTSYI